MVYDALPRGRNRDVPETGSELSGEDKSTSSSAQMFKYAVCLFSFDITTPPNQYPFLPSFSVLGIKLFLSCLCLSGPYATICIDSVCYCIPNRALVA